MAFEKPVLLQLAGLIIRVDTITKATLYVYYIVKFHRKVTLSKVYRSI